MIDLRLGGYRCIVMDPPWAEVGGCGKGADKHYSVMQTPEIGKVISRSGVFNPAPSCHLWMWVTDNFLLDGLGLMDWLGFRFVRTFCWAKVNDNKQLQIGLGQYARGAHELCLFGVRGDPMVPVSSNRPPSVIMSRRTRHSKKPDDCFARWFERVSPGPRLEMFAREKREGWDVWGNEV